MARTDSPYQLIACFRVPRLRAFNQREIVVSIASVLVASECLGEMIGCLLVFTATVVRKAQSNVSGRKAPIAFQGLFVRAACLALFTLFVKGQALYINLFSAGRNLRIRN